MKTHFLCCLTALVMAVNLASAGQTYYVGPRGNDGLDGRTEVTAWRSVSRVNNENFAPGDVVKFERGGVWREPLKPKSGGTADAPVTFSAYGRGERPLFVGSDDVETMGFRIPLSAETRPVQILGAAEVGRRDQFS